MNYYYVLNKDNCDDKKIYFAFEQVLSSKAIVCRRRSGLERETITFNGDEYVSICRYVKESVFKVPCANSKEFKQSNLKNIFANYRAYVNYLKCDSFLKKPISYDKFCKQNKTEKRKDYYRYLDSISRKYPIDLNMFFKNIKKDEIIKEIFEKFNKTAKEKDVAYCYASENAYSKYIQQHNGIIFVINNSIKIEKTVLIPNLDGDFFNLNYQKKIANSNPIRYTNLIGEVQVKDKIDLKNVKFIIVDKKLDLQKIKNLIKQYNIKIKIKKG